MSMQQIQTPSPGKRQQFLAWHNDVPYLVNYVPHGDGYFDHFSFQVADTDFRHTLADDRREFFADPDDVVQSGSPMQYLENVLAVRD